MQEFIPNAILWTLALYGLIEIAKTIRYYFACTKFKQDGIYLIIALFISNGFSVFSVTIYRSHCLPNSI